MSATQESPAAPLSASQKKRLRQKKQKAAAAAAAADATANGFAPQKPETQASAAPSESAGKNSKKPKKKKKKFKPVFGFEFIAESDYRKHGQSYPPTKPVSTLFPDQQFPPGETMHYHQDDNRFRVTDEEKRALERSEDWEERMTIVREAAEIHRNVRQDAQKFIKPGMEFRDICRRLEDTNRRLTGVDPENPLARGIGFPTGISPNEIAAHWTPNSNDKRCYKADDIIKIDFGTQIQGHIIDCAFTLTHSNRYDNLMKAVKDATETGIKEAGIGVRLNEIGAAIHEAMTSYELEVDGKTFPVKCCENLCGHSIGPYQIHAGKSVPIVDNGDETKMEEGEMFAIETFGTTGQGHVYEDGVTSHYMRDFDLKTAPLRNPKAKKLLEYIDATFGTLAFCRRWLDDAGHDRHLMALRDLVKAGLVKEYPPLVDPGENCYTAQYEHTIMLKPTSKEIFSRGADF